MHRTDVLARSGHLLALLALLAWLALIGWSVWQHASRAEQPPVHDAQTYYMKAHSFWANLHGAERVNPLNLAPYIRPPGTVLMAYPLGFDADFRGFYFRSVFLPIVLLAIGIVLAGYDRKLEAASNRYLVLVAAFLATLPAFYHFQVSRDFPMVSYWGLVDNFLAAVAALGAAAGIRSVRSRSVAWACAAAILTSLCVLIKPSGVLVTVLINLAFVGLAALRLRSEAHLPGERRRTIRWLERSFIVVAGLNAIVLTASLASRYLSPKSLVSGNAAIEIMKSEINITWPVLRDVVHMGLGYPFLLWLLSSVLLVAWHWRRLPAGSPSSNKALLAGLAIASGATFAFGIWFWIAGSGGTTQIRYFVPFALVAVTFAVPVLVRVMPLMRPWATGLLVLPMIFAIAHTGILLMQRDPSLEWQKWAGVNLTSGAADPAGIQARDFARAVKREGRRAFLYSMPGNVTDAEFQAAVDYARIADPPMPKVTIHRPVDWQRPTAFRVKEMLESDYWLFEPVRDRRLLEAALATPSIDDYDRELALFQAWATQLTPADGVAIVSETPVARVLRVTDRVRLDSALGAMLQGRRWRPVFLAANASSEWGDDALAKALARFRPSLQNIRFGDRIELRALSVSRDGQNLTVRVWWRPMPGLKEIDWIFFVHSVDADGNIRQAHQIQLGARDQALRDGSIHMNRITFADPSREKSDQLAIGFYRPDEILVADSGTRDWNGKRVVVPLP